MKFKYLPVHSNAARSAVAHCDDITQYGHTKTAFFALEDCLIIGYFTSYVDRENSIRSLCV